MADPTYETKESRRTDAIYQIAYNAADRELRNGIMQIASDLLDHPHLDAAFTRILSQHYRRELTPEQFATQMSTLLCDLVTEVAEWAAERKLSE